MSTNALEIPAEKIFEARNVPCSVKHGQILQRWRALPLGDYFVLRNDHDPVPLRYQFMAESPNQFTWEYLERGPEVFSVKISRVQAG